MRPVRLEIENLRSFRTKRIIEFGEPRLFAIVGDTGAGKTSILEAITYALFNRSTWDGREVTALIAKGARSMSVTLTFVVDGDEFTITRITRIGRQPTQRLDCLARGISVSTQPDVDRELYKALHFDADTFLHTVLLPQGQHAELLTKKPNQRNKILAEIFHLDAIGDVLEQTKLLEAKADTALQGLRRERSDYPADSSAALSSAKLQLEHAVVSVSAAVAALKAVQALDAQDAKVNADRVSLTERVSRLATPPDAIVALESIERTETALNVERAECLRDIDGAELIRRNAQERTDKLRSHGMDADSVHEVERTLDELAIQNREVAAATEKTVELRASLAQCLVTRETASAQLESAENDRATHKNQSTIFQTELQSAAESLRQLELDAVSWKQAIGTLARIETTLAKLLANDKTFRAELVLASTAKEEALADLSNATIALDVARRTNGAAALAEHLHVGDSCPVCSRTLPTTFSPPANADFSAASSVVDAKTIALQKCATLVDRLTTQIESSEILIVTAQEEARNAKLICDSLVTKQSLLRDSSRTLEAEIVAQVEAVSILTISAQQASSAFDDATERHRAASAGVALADGQAISITAQIDDLRLKLKGRLNDLKRLMEQLPDLISELISGDDISKCRTLLSEWRREALAVAELLGGARIRLNDCNERLAEISQRKTQLVVAPRQLLIGTISPIAASLGLPAPPAKADESKAWARTVISTAGAEIDKCVWLKDSLIRESELIREARQARVEDLGGEPQAMYTEALIAQTRAEAELATVTDALKRAQQIDEKTVALEPAALGLAALKATLGARAFLAYATMQRQQRLLEIASGILSEMVDGRYAFTSDFEILDRSSNEVRSTNTLSGGEKFLASLALSLAVVEIAANGGAKIEALFLDEGFDSLDATMLPMAMLELSKRSHAGRTICVITHVLDAAQFVSDTLLVRKTGDGSEVVSIDGPLDEDTAALEGLVSQLSA